MKWYKDLSWIGYLNFFILQWIFIRVTKQVYLLDYTEKKYMPNTYKIIKWILPLTGWWNDYIYLIDWR